MNIVETAINAGNFKTLVAAVQAAGLVDTLSGEGPFTVFAPTDEAFADLSQSLEDIMANKSLLTKVLTYHVVSGKVMSSELTGKTQVATLEGGELKIDTSSGVRINLANVVTPDIECSNGVIHVIDRVLLPQ